jgi:hypothetical protein
MKKIVYVMFFILTRLLSNNNKTLILLIPFLFAVQQICQSQIEQENRYEYPLIGTTNSFEVIPAGESGLFTYRTFNFNQKQSIELTKLDTSLQVNWSGFLPIEIGSTVISKIIYNKRLYLLARFRSTSEFFFELYSIDIEVGTYSRTIINSYIPFNPTEFKVTATSRSKVLPRNSMPSSPPTSQAIFRISRSHSPTSRRPRSPIRASTSPRSTRFGSRCSI